MTWEVGDVTQECSRWESLSNPGNDGHLDPGAPVLVLTEAQTLGVLWSGKLPINQIRCGLWDTERSEWFQGCSDLHGPRARKHLPPGFVRPDGFWQIREREFPSAPPLGCKELMRSFDQRPQLWPGSAHSSSLKFLQGSPTLWDPGPWQLPTVISPGWGGGTTPSLSSSWILSKVLSGPFNKWPSSDD